MQDRGQRRVAADRIGDRFEPALEAAIERVVVPALVVRLVRLAGNPRRGGAKYAEPPAPVASAVSHVGIDAEVVPTGGKTLPIGEPSLLQQPPHFRRAHKGKAVALDLVSERSEQFYHWGPPEG